MKDLQVPNAGHLNLQCLSIRTLRVLKARASPTKVARNFGRMLKDEARIPGVEVGFHASRLGG